ncbi:gamma-mobile-trio protein GmtX [Hydrogenophaga sp. 2FB]|uniref:gamma-mobile-trio protein GmtX n=1 Tax=Hydrogenophaga sp. 2FB TaxID=2502187 RepID=UPI0010FA042E|nr:gamma-mobile-trio protein GmtX [Hydrogenophaga sp. 2FB]
MRKEVVSSTIHPDLVLEGLLARTNRSDKRKNLLSVHEVCRAHHKIGSKDFSLATIGKVVTAAGVLKAGVLKTRQSQDYRELILGWAAYAGPVEIKKGPRVEYRDDAPKWLMNIEDPAARSAVQSVIIERDRLRLQLNTLKAQSQIVVDMRPIPAELYHGDREIAQSLPATARLNDLEREAIFEAASSEFLAGEGWCEGDHGAVVNERGRTVYRVGYLSGLRKMLRGG